ncbi:sigma-70 family RNA polymerase sigma factor [Bacillus pumilus]|uniref:sigma-70 family RNA polymerase sigma factor n=2 Tax=Bacillus pumilus TaxID=1408 RepID=UPI0011E94A5E|nr:sigma-70 family RNA polymerase sigma factor [Bacillus pumilus]TYS40511.1 sigma-70 family RNA polymerase sigma factor [Bacillus pumilus]
MNDLILEYTDTLTYVKQMHAQMDETNRDFDEVSRIISDMEYCVSWMKNKRQPELKRPIERRSLAQRTAPISEDILCNLAFYASPTIEEVEYKMSSFDMNRIETAMQHLTKREREIYMCIVVEEMSFSKCAELFGVAKGTIQVTVNRAKKKISKQVQLMKEKNINLCNS